MTRANISLMFHESQETERAIYNTKKNCNLMPMIDVHAGRNEYYFCWALRLMLLSFYPRSISLKLLAQEFSMEFLYSKYFSKEPSRLHFLSQRNFKAHHKNIKILCFEHIVKKIHFECEFSMVRNEIQRTNQIE